MQYDLLRNKPSVKNVTSLTNLVSCVSLTDYTTRGLQWNLSTGMHRAYCTRYSVGCERVFSKLCLVKEELRSTRWTTQRSDADGSGKEHSEGSGLADIDVW